MTVDCLIADWPAPPGIVAGTSLAYASDANMALHTGHDPAQVHINRQRLARSVDIGEPWHWLQQVHGTEVHDVDTMTVDVIPAADALYSASAGASLAIMTADCLPVLFVSQDGVSLAAAHAGWRGLAGGVLEATLARFSQPRSTLLAWLGPAISQPAFEVGGEVRATFLARDADLAAHFVKNARGRWQANLYGLAHTILARAGVEQVFGGGFCTYTEAQRFYSYRRDPQCGRMVSFIGRQSPQ